MANRFQVELHLLMIMLFLGSKPSFTTTHSGAAVYFSAAHFCSTTLPNQTRKFINLQSIVLIAIIMDNKHYKDAMQEEVYEQLRLDILSDSTVTLSYGNTERGRCLKNMINSFWETLRYRLKLPGLTYLNLFSVKQNDLAVYGDCLMSYLKRAKAMLDLSDCQIEEYEDLLKKYNLLAPTPLLEFRKLLFSVRANQLETKKYLIKFEEDNCKINHQLVTFRSVQFRPTTGTFSQKINNFLQQIEMSPETCANLRKVIKLLNQALKNSELGDFSPKLLPFGSLMTGLASFSSDIDLVIKFETLDVDVIDFETSLVALEVIRPILNQKLGLSISEKCIYPSKRCPIIALMFDQCMPSTGFSVNGLQYNRCDISIRNLYSYYNSKLLEFLVSYDRRFYEMAMLLKYWAKKTGLIDKEMLSTFGFYMMIVFVMQQTSPPCLPTIERLQELAQHQSNYKPIEINSYNFAFCNDPAIIGKSSCPITTEQLLLNFIKLYQNFDYRNQAISPRLGRIVSKNSLYAKNNSENLGDTNSVFKRTFIVIEDPFVFDNNCGGIFHRFPMERWRDAFDAAANRIHREPNYILEIFTNPQVTLQYE